MEGERMPPPATVTRDRPTVAGYGLVATWGFFLYFMGPVSPVIAREMGVPIAAAGLTGIVLALGIITAGFGGPKLVGAVGRWRAGRIALLCMAFGAFALAAMPGFAGVLPAVYVCAFGGGLMANVATAVLADRQGEAGPRAITEANAVAAWVGLTAPALIGAVVGVGWGWRPAAVAVGVVALAMLVFFVTVPAQRFDDRRGRVGGAPVPAGTGLQPEPPAPPDPPPHEPPAAQGPLPGAFYWSLVAILVAVGTEISLNFWGGVLVSQRTGADLATATATVSALVAGIAVGRTIGARLTAAFTPRFLVFASLILAAAGFTVVLLSGSLWLSITGLFVNGLGFALLYPLTQSMAISHSGGRSDLAVGIMSIMVGVSMGLAPFVLGALSGLVGVQNAFLIVPALLLFGAFALVRADARPAGSPSH
jgi:fucose permease